VREVVKLAKAAEEAGFDSVWIPDMTPKDTFTIMSAIGLSTDRISVGAGIAGAYWRTPAATASAIAVVDEISNGRAKLALGTGMPNWCRQMGLRFEKQIATIKEHMEIVRLLLQGKKVNYSGQIYEYRDFQLEFTPIRSDVPMYVGGMGPKFTRLAGQIADGLILGALSHPKTVSMARETLNEAAIGSGRKTSDIELGALLSCFISEDGVEAKKVAKEQVAWYAAADHYQRILPQIGYGDEAVRIRTATERGDYDTAVKSVTDSMVENLCLAGRPQECREKMESWLSAGLTMPVLYHNTSLKNASESYRLALKTFAP
jgi:5,10-methylenetetrahydromethanopterin reductase